VPQIVPHPDFSGSSRLLMYLDGAHTPESMVSCAQWFASVTTQQQQQQQQQASTNNTSNAAATAAAAGQQQPVRVLIFNCMKERDPSVLLSQLHSELRRQGTPVHVALFVPPDSQYAFLPSSSKSALVAAAHQDLSWQQQLAGVWRQCDTGAAAAAGQQPDGDEAAALRALLPPLPVVEGGCEEAACAGCCGKALRVASAQLTHQLPCVCLQASARSSCRQTARQCCAAWLMPWAGWPQQRRHGRSCSCRCSSLAACTLWATAWQAWTANPRDDEFVWRRSSSRMMVQGFRQGG
jgi:hypothetical protein